MRFFFILIMTLLISATINFRASAQDVIIYLKKDNVVKYPIASVDSLSITQCYQDSITIIAISPNSDCVTTDLLPVFTWKIRTPNRKIGIMTYEIRVGEIAITDTSFDNFDTKVPILVVSGIDSIQFTFPANSPRLEMGKIYAWRVRAFEEGKLVAISDVKPFYIINYPFPFDIKEVLCCTNSLISNGDFQTDNKAGILDAGGNILNWHTGYGSPIVKPDNDGCQGPGYVQLEGSMLSGSSIKQQLLASRKITQGKHYRFSACVRLHKPDVKHSDYVLIKAVAFNSNLPNTGTHPLPNSDLALIGWTGKLTLKEWGTVSLNAWTPNKNFDNIAVYCYTNSKDTSAVCDIDNICLVETTDSISCDDYAYNANGQPIIDSLLVSQAQDTTYNFYEEYTGITTDLYSSLGNTSIDTWYPNNDPCASIGGSVPIEVQNINFNDTLHSLGYPGTTEDLEKQLSQTFSDTSQPIKLLPIPPYIQNCDKPFVYDKDMPFGGRDIIFVHGLKLQHLCDRAAKVKGADANWPINHSEFKKGGYYKTLAEDGWADHIKTWLTNKGFKNRYLIVSYNCSQPMNVAVHAMLTQIRNAMHSGDGEVVFDPTDPRKDSCFGRNCVIISHSTGGLLTDVAMSIAERSNTDPITQAQFGNAGYIPDQVKAHVAFHSVLAGSAMATVFLGAQLSPPLGTLLNNIGVCKGLTIADPLMQIITFSSILIDLQPGVVSTKWSPLIQTTPVPTITVVGGHPFGVDDVGILNWELHPGLDDGVSTMSSQSGNPNIETGAKPSGYYRSLITHPFSVYDMCISPGRANSYYMNQTKNTVFGYVGGASVNHLSATGMVQPVGSIVQSLSCENRYNNHYSFIQSASDHYKGPRGKSVKEGFNPANFPASSGFPPPDYRYAEGYGSNFEESRAITNTDIYTRGLVSPIVANLQFEHLCGSYITIPIPIPNFSFKIFPPEFRFWWSWYYLNITIWERKYHNLIGYESESECSYVYKYVLRQ